MTELFNNADFLEALIKVLYTDQEALNKAKGLELKPSDFGTVGIYNAFVESIMTIGYTNGHPSIYLNHIKHALPKYGVVSHDYTQVLDFWEFIFDGQLTAPPQYITENLADFIKFRRFQALKLVQPATLEEMAEAVSKLMETRQNAGEIKEYEPFSTAINRPFREKLLTGFDAIDQCTGGLSYQEMGLILAHSGSGKTAMAAFMALQAAKMGRKALYLSIEEDGLNVIDRLYSNAFRLPYSDLHNGCVITQKERDAALEQLSPADSVAYQNCRVHDLRERSPISCKSIKEHLDSYCERTGWAPDLVFIDQLDYLQPSKPCRETWQAFERCSFDVDELSNQLICGTKPFSVWLLHQIHGKMVKKFTNGEIAGFKGVIKPADMALALGRAEPTDPVVSIFSLKCRHAKNFQFDYYADLKHMNFEEMGHAETSKVAEENKEKKTLTQSNYANIPAKPVARQVASKSVLPPPGGGFK